MPAAAVAWFLASAGLATAARPQAFAGLEREGQEVAAEGEDGLFESSRSRTFTGGGKYVDPGCPSALRDGSSPWRFFVDGRDIQHLRLGDAYELRCGGERLDGAEEDLVNRSAVEVHEEHNPDSPLDGRAVIIIAVWAREALVHKGCRTAQVGVRGKEGSCLAELPVPAETWWPLSTDRPRKHVHRLLYALPMGSSLKRRLARVDEAEPVVVDYLAFAIIALAFLAIAALLARGCRGALSREGEPFSLPPPAGLLVPSADDITKQVCWGLVRFAFALASVICAATEFPVIRANGYAILFLLVVPTLIAPAAVWRVALTWHRVCDSHLHLCRGQRLKFESHLGPAGRWVALQLSCAGALVALSLAAELWRGGLGAQEVAKKLLIMGQLFLAAWQAFSSIVALESGLSAHRVSADHLEKAPVTLPRLAPLAESTSLASRRAGADDDSRAAGEQQRDEEHEAEAGASFSPVDIVRLGNALCRWARSPEEVDEMLATGRRKSRGHALEAAFLFAFLLALTSVGLGMRHAVSYPVLAQSATADGHMAPGFSPEIREYDILVDSGQADLGLFLQCDPEDTAHLEVQWPGRPLMVEDKTCTVLNRTGKRHIVPATVSATVDNGLWSTDYAFRVRPVQVLAKTLVVRGTIAERAREFVRCVRWGELPGTSISLPTNLSNVTFEVATDTYEFNLPLDLDGNDDRLHDQNDFVTGFRRGLAAEKCDEDCRHDPRCVAHLSVDAGCYQVMGPHDCFSHHHAAPRLSDVEDSEVRRFMDQRTLKGRLCFLDPKSTEHCTEMGSNMRDGVLALSDIEGLISYIENRSEGLMKISVSAASNVTYDTSATAISFLRGTPPVLAMPATLHVREGAVQTPRVVMSSRPSIRVELSKYDLPEAGGADTHRAMRLHLVPLLEDPDFLASWFDNGTDVTASNTSVDFSESCDRSPGLRRFQACGGVRSNSGAQISISLDPWRPSRHLTVRIEPRWLRQGSHFLQLPGFDPLDVPVEIATANDEEPLQWAIRERCATDADEALYTPTALRELAALCDTPEAITKVKDFIKEHRDQSSEVSSMLMAVGENPKNESIFQQLRDVTPARALIFLVGAGAKESVQLAICRNVRDDEMPRTLAAIPEDVIPTLAPCVMSAGRDIAALVVKSVHSLCEGCARAVGSALTTYQGRLSFHAKKLGLYQGSVKTLAAALEQMSALTSLNLLGNGLGDHPGAAEQLAAALEKMLAVTSLNLAQNGLGDHPGAAERLAAALEKMLAVTSLNLEQNGLGGHPGAAERLAAALEKLPAVTSLILAINGLGVHPRAAERLAAALESMPTVTYLNLGMNDLGKHPGAAERLAAALEKLPAVTSLNLGNNFLGKHPGAEERLAAALEKMLAVTSLNLKQNRLGKYPGAAERLAAALEKMPALTSLALAGNGLGNHPGAAKAFGAALGKMPRVTSLDLAGNDLGEHPGAAEHLAAALQKMPALTSLNLAGNGLGKHQGAAKALVAALGKLTAVTDLILGGNDLGKDPAIQAALERLRAENPNRTIKW